MAQLSPEGLEELVLRFITAAPSEHLMNTNHLMFLVEHAYWYYEDHLRDQDPSLHHFGNLNTFAEMLFKKSDYLATTYQDKLPDILENFRNYKKSIPVCGAIMLDQTLEKVLLVRGYKSSAGWGFPRGKINQNEALETCAIREVLEETGMDMESMLQPQDYIENYSDGKLNRLYIITGLEPETAKFRPQLKSEIGGYSWHYVRDLPATIEEANKVYMSLEGTRHRFFMVQPFVPKLRTWIKAFKFRLNQDNNAQGINTRAVKGANQGPGAKLAQVGGKGANATTGQQVATQQVVTQLATADVAGGAGQKGAAPTLSLGNISMANFQFDRVAIMKCFTH